MTRRVLYLCVALVLFSFLPINAQTISRYKYWVDNDLEHISEVLSSRTDVTLSFDTKPMSSGVHFVNFCAQNSNGKWTKVKHFVFYKPSPNLEEAENPSLARYTYWLDNGPKTEAKFSSDNVVFDLKTDTLSSGVHFFNFCAQNSNGKWTKVKHFVFYKPTPNLEEAENPSLVRYTYWLDNGPKTEAKFSSDNVVFDLKTDTLSSGVHFFNFCAQNSNGKWTKVKHFVFYKPSPNLEEAENPSLVRYTYWLDNGPKTEAKFSSDNVVFDLKTDTLSSGVHFFNFCVQNSNGKWTKVKHFVFYKPTPNLEEAENPSLVRYTYWLDNGPKTEAKFSSDNVVFDLKTDTLSSGVHFFNFCAQNSNGKWSKVKHFVFYKPTAQSSQLMEYEYWFDDDVDNSSTYRSGSTEVVINISTHNLSEGLHRLNIRQRPLGGEWGEIRLHEFVKTSTQIEKCRNVVFDYDGQSVLKMNTETSEANIFYKIGNALQENYSKYEAPLTLTDNRPIYAYAAAAGYENSDTVCFTPTNFRVAPVEISFSEPWLSMSCQTEDATIHYSHNGEEDIYSSPIEINQPCEVYVWAEKPYFNNSDTVSYNIIRCAEPVISYADGRVSISCTNEGAKIFYTLDNSEPDSTALSYTEPFAVNNNTEIRAVAYLDGALHSHIANYNINTFKLSAPTFEYDEPWLSIKSTSDDATIHYILNGEEDIYDEPLKIAEPCDIYAWATKENFNNSDTVFYHVDVAAREFFFDGLLFRIISFEDNSCEVIANGADGYTGDIRIPEMAVRYGEPWLVTAIAEGAFGDCRKVTSIIIPDNIRSIGAKSLETGNLNALVYCSSHILPLVPEGTRNIIVDGITERITLQEGYDFSCPEPFTAEKISYDREFRQHTGLGYSEGWETLTLPFDVQTVYHRDKQTEIRPIVSGEASALPGFWLRAFTADGFMPAGEIRANTPYIISMPNNEEYVEAARLPGRVSFRAVNATVPVSTMESSFAGGRMFVPATTAVPQSESVFVLNSGEPFEGHPSGSVFVSALRGVRPFEAYLSAENSARILSIGELLGDASAIQDVTADDEGRLTICSLNGVQLKRISAAQLPEAMSSLPKGVYIINNKKVLVK